MDSLEHGAAPAPSADQGSEPAPVFVTLTTGLGALPEAVAKASNADIRTSAMVRALERTAPIEKTPARTFPVVIESLDGCFVIRDGGLVLVIGFLLEQRALKIRRECVSVRLRRR